ncbi:MAG TPA: GDP-fucose synthetase [Desulfovibrio sp.]|nr:GDP-fucose synthetase [Desulfovibrio sp.]
MDKKSKIFVAGAEKALGIAIVNALENSGYSCVIKGHEPVYCNQQDVDSFFELHRPDVVVIAAGKSGGISYNQQKPATLIYDNIMTEANLIEAAHKYNVGKLLYLASSCSYPRLSPQPITEDSLLTGSLEPTNQPYAVAKIAGIELCRAYKTQHGDNFISAVPTNYFGPGDDFSPENSHVIGALIRRVHEAKLNGDSGVNIWGTGKPRREFIFSRDLGNACVYLLENYNESEHINIGSGYSLSIAEVAALIAEVVGFEGDLSYDTSKPDGMPVKELDSSKLAAIGWESGTPFRKALEITYDWFRSEYNRRDS